MAGSGEFFHWDTKYHSGESGSKRSSLKLPERPLRFPLPSPKPLKVDLLSLALRRCSVRRFSRDTPLSLEELSTVVWFSLGSRGSGPGRPLRVFPSAGALYPTEAIVAVRLVDGLSQGVYRYVPEDHSLSLIGLGDVSRDLARASLSQMWVSDAQVIIVLTAVVSRMTAKYGDRGFRYIYMEAGHVGQGIYLAASAMGLGTCAIGAFFDDEVASVVGVDASSEIPLYLFPLGKP